jgi:hypothetical protein
MSVTHLKFKIDPEKIPPGLRNIFLELYNWKEREQEKEYYGWIIFHPDGTIEIGEPGE